MFRDPTISVHCLADVPEYGEIALEWIFSTWGSHQSRSLEEVRARAAQYANRDTLPMMFVAELAGTPAGCVVLREQDMQGHEHLSPWLASLYVKPEFRHRGIATRLIKAVENAATQLQYPAVYLFTPDARALYEKLGWEMLAEHEHDGQVVAVMIKRLGGCAPQ